MVKNLKLFLYITTVRILFLMFMAFDLIDFIIISSFTCQTYVNGLDIPQTIPHITFVHNNASIILRNHIIIPLYTNSFAVCAEHG